MINEFSMSPEVADAIIRDHFPDLFRMAGITTVRHHRNLYKLARFIKYTRPYIDKDLTINEVVSYLMEYPEIYEYLKL